MAKSQYNGDSPFPSPFLEHPGMSGSPETIPVTTIPFPALPATEASSMPAFYILKDSGAMYVGETAHCVSRLRDHDVDGATTRLGEASPPPTTTAID
ncbi:hypothetical protein [Bradyrhizobium sp. JYMT SZCCT0180]|uniref:hypothetical protein n=1 Tax=Bradyrhizobium sp. JYMT SZCCT0180 TaxID=2807666 RepID=UPI001BAC3F18|nr:hypothetical protein [Bradyrhizobium sp. JYMT SZCCT0180]MBR1214632.1 hypothetical protein [Bradyrhizobium sp. JYMT SZCCT0180]